MKKKHTPIINIITYGLPRKLAMQIYNEHAARLKEAEYIINLPARYNVLKKEIKTVDILLALTIFHKRVITCLEGADKFYGTVVRYGGVNTISMGNYKFSEVERNKVLGLLINYRNMVKKLNIPITLMDYNLTKEFLSKLIELKNITNEKRQKKKDDKTNFGEINPEDLPF